jgi:hypothetical protein
MKNMILLSIGYVFGVISCLMVYIGKVQCFPNPRQALPVSARYSEECHEYGFTPDFSYTLEAAVTDEQFQTFVRKMRFPESSRKNAYLYMIGQPDSRYQKTAQYFRGTLRFEESRN